MIKLTIVSIHQQVFCQEVDFFVLEAKDGQLGIYPNHISLLSVLKPGLVKVHLNNQQPTIFFIAGGMLEVFNNEATILADAVERSIDLDEEKVLFEKKLALSKKQKREHYIYDKDNIFYDELQVLLAKIKAVKFINQK